jgi:hypothetical protein
MNLAITPAIKPMMMVQRMLISTSPLSKQEVLFSDLCPG